MHLWLSKGAIRTHWMASGVLLTALSLLLYRLLFKSRGPFQFLRFGRGSGLHHHHHATERNLTPGGGHGKNGFSQILGLKPSPKADWLLLYLCSSLPSFSFLFFLSFFFYIRWQCEFFFFGHLTYVCAFRPTTQYKNKSKNENWYSLGYVCLL